MTSCRKSGALLNKESKSASPADTTDTLTGSQVAEKTNRSRLPESKPSKGSILNKSREC